MSARVSRVLLSLVILGWSATLLYFHASGRISRYLAPDFRMICLLGGLGLAVLGLFNLLLSGEEVHTHEHGSSDLPSWVVSLLMLVPTGLSIAWTRDAYSPSALARKGLYAPPPPAGTLVGASKPFTREDLEKSHRKSPDGYYDFNLIEIFLAAGDREQQGLLDGLKVTTLGRIVTEKKNNPQGSRMRLYRLFMTCCAADGRAIPIILEFGKVAPQVEENAWVRVRGTLSFPITDGRMQPVLQVEQWESAAAPAEESFLRR